MRKVSPLIAFSIALLNGQSAAADLLPIKPGAVEIGIFGIGPPVDARAVDKVRRTAGASIATGVTDTYFVRGYGIEGGFSACAQKSPFGVVQK